VKIPDLNLLIYAVDETAKPHAKARPWLEETLSGVEEVGFAWTVLLGFVRLATNPAIFEEPFEAGEAIDQCESWLAQPCATIVTPSIRHLDLLRDLLDPLGTAANLVSDAHLAALAIEHGAELLSSDADFSRFPGLRWRDPLR
jgi:toxin-antitoxin system PIN domain toxin